MTEPSKPPCNCGSHKLAPYYHRVNCPRHVGQPAGSIVPRPTAEIDDALGTPQQVIDRRPAVSVESGEPPSAEELLRTLTGLLPSPISIVWPPRALDEIKAYASACVSRALAAQIENAPRCSIHKDFPLTGHYCIQCILLADIELRSRIAELKRTLTEIGNTVGAPLPDYYGAGPQREAFLNTARTISALCAAAPKEKQ